MNQTLVLVVPPQLGLLEGFANGVISLANYILQQLPSLRVEVLDLGVASPEAAEAAVQWAVAQAKGPLVLGITTTTAS